MNERFFRFLRERIGLDVESVGAPMVERTLRQRCVAMNAIDLDDYWLRLQQSADEQQALIEAVIVPETWFFRYPESFTALASLAHKRLAELAGARPLRLLSLPCSTGEEPYSLAMALLDAGIAPGAFLIDGMDISPNSVAKAGQAVYGRNAFRGSDLGFRERYFDALDEGHRLHERVQQQVSLQVGNVLDPALATRDGLYDFVFCRNLLIYFDVATQQRVFEVLKRLLHPQGVLFIGPAEGSLLARMGMRPLGIAQSFAYVRQEGSSTPQAAAPAQPARRTVLPQAPVGYPPPSRHCRVRYGQYRWSQDPRRHANPNARTQTNCWPVSPGLPMLAPANRRVPNASATWASTRRRHRFTTGWGCSVIPTAMRSRH